MTDKYTLKFVLDTKATSELVEGILKLYKNGEVYNEYRATASIPGRQEDGSWNERGGLIPPGKSYKVDVTPLYMPSVRGVEGNFYVISPYLVKTAGATRGDFGIHFDANVPGSLGCVVLRTARGWEAFERDIRTIVKPTGVKQIPLIVEYV